MPESKTILCAGGPVIRNDEIARLVPGGGARWSLPPVVRIRIRNGEVVLFFPAEFHVLSFLDSVGWDGRASDP